MEIDDIGVLVPSTRLVASPHHLGKWRILSFRVIRVPHIEECKNLLPAQIVNVYTAILFYNFLKTIFHSTDLTVLSRAEWLFLKIYTFERIIIAAVLNPDAFRLMSGLFFIPHRHRLTLLISGL